MKITPEIRTESKQEKKQKQEFKFIGSMRKRRGHKLFGLCPDKGAYEVEIKDKKTFDMSKKNEHGQFKAVINPNHSMVFALNIKNAKRKFSR